ncbi:MAG: hypothetical protein R6X14_08310, partial [bacterium]
TTLKQGYGDRAIPVLKRILEREPDRQDVRERLEEIANGTVEDRGAQPRGESADREVPGPRRGAVAPPAPRRRTVERVGEREQFATWIDGIRRHPKGN